MHYSHIVSNALLTIPDEGTKPEHGIIIIVTLETVEQRGHLFIRHNRNDGTVHGRPGVSAKMRITTLAATSTSLLEDGVATHVGISQGFHHIVLMCLIICNKNCLHNFIYDLSFVTPPRDGNC